MCAPLKLLCEKEKVVGILGKICFQFFCKKYTETISNWVPVHWHSGDFCQHGQKYNYVQQFWNNA